MRLLHISYHGASQISEVDLVAADLNELFTLNGWTWWTWVTQVDLTGVGWTSDWWFCYDNMNNNMKDNKSIFKQMQKNSSSDS